MLGAFHLLAAAAFFVPTWDGLAWLIALHALTAGVGISVGYHRAFAHRALAVDRRLVPVLAFLGSATFEGGPLRWAALHRAHHRHSDDVGDPHSAARGWWFSHFGWAFFRGPNGYRFRHLHAQVKDLAGIASLRFFEAYHFWVQLAVALAALPLLGLPLWLWAFPLRIVAVWHTTWCVNSFAHRAQHAHRGEVGPINLPLFAWLSYGEGWHLNHHRAPHAARFARWDVGFWIARQFERVGLLSIRPAAMGKR